MAECEWAILCDYAFKDAGRKTCMIGVFDRIFTMAVPAQHHQVSLVAKFVGDPNEAVQFSIELTRPTGGLLVTLPGELKINESGTGDLIANLQGLTLPDFGLYGFNIVVGQGPPKNVGLTVVQLKASPGKQDPKD